MIRLILPEHESVPKRKRPARMHITEIPRRAVKPRVPTKFFDAGRRTDGFGGERHDCVVRAFALFAGMTYAESHEIMRENGRIEGRGMHRHQYIPVLEKYGKELLEARELNRIYHDRPCCTLGRFIKDHPYGTYFVVVRKHATCIIDGVVHDTFVLGPRKIVEMAWERRGGE